MRPRTVRTFVCLALAACWAAAAVHADEAASPEPPVRYVIQSAQVRAAPVEGAVQGTMDVTVRHLAGDPTWVPLFAGNVGVLSATAADGGWFADRPMLMRRGDAVGMLLDGKGRYDVHFEFATPIHSVRRTNSSTLPMVSALSSAYEVALPGENLELTLEPKLPHQVTRSAGQTVLRVYGTAEGGLRLTWEPAPEVREVETVAFAEQEMLMDASPGLLRVETTLRYSVLQGRMPRADIAVPAGYSVLKVDGSNIRNWEMIEDESAERTLSVTLLDPELRSFDVRLTLEKTLEPVPVEVEAPQVTALGVRRQKGVIGVAVERGLQAEILERTNVGQVSLAQMPDAFRRGDRRVSLALRYLARPFGVRLRISTIEPKVYGEVSCLTIASLQRFRQHWDVKYEIRNAGLFQLKVGLAPGMKLVSLEGESINNQTLDPQTNVVTVDLRSKAEGDYRLGLQTYSDIEDGASAALPSITLVGAERQWGTIALATDAAVAVEAGGMDGISQIDVGELERDEALAEMVAAQKAPEPMLAFRYLNVPWALQLEVSRVRAELKAQPLHVVEITSKNLRYHSTFNYRIKKAGVFQLRLHLPAELRGSLVVRGPRVEDYSYDAPTETLTVQLSEKTSDEVTLELESEMLLPKNLPDPGASDIFPLPAVYTLGSEQERGYLAIATTESIRLKRAGTGPGLHDVDVQEVDPALLQKADDAKLAFRIIESPWSLDLQITRISPKLLTRTFNYIRFGEDYLIGASTIEFNIQYAGVKEFFVLLPEGVQEPNIRGDNIKIQEEITPGQSEDAGSFVERLLGPGRTEPPPGHLWRVELQGEVEGRYQLIFEYTMELDPQEGLRRFSGPKVMGIMPEVEREIGYLAVTGDPSLELSVDAEQIGNLTPIDEEEIPVRFRELPQSVADQIGRQTVPILFAFRYLSHPYELVVSSVKHAEADVVTAVIESCKLDTTLTREGNSITLLVAQVRSRYQPFLEVRLPEGAKLWHALVNGRRVRPLTENSDDGQLTKIPIAQVQGVQGPVRVEAQWEELNRGELGALERVRLQMPDFMGVRVLRLGWVLQLPREYSILSSRGTLEWLPGSHSFEPVLRDLKATKSPAGAPRVPRGEQQAESGTTQMASNVSVLSGRTGARQSRRGPIFAGAKPELPEKFYFQALVLNPDAPPQVRATCLSGPTRQVTLALTVLVTAALCALVWWKLGLSPRASFVVLIAVALALAGARVIAEQDYRQVLLAVPATAAACAVAFGATALVSRLRAWRE